MSVVLAHEFQVAAGKCQLQAVGETHTRAVGQAIYLSTGFVLPMKQGGSLFRYRSLRLE